MSFRKRNLDVLFAVFAVIISASMLTAIISYSSMVRYSRDSMQEAIPQQKLFLLGSLVGELQNAENSIRSYRLSRDQDWLDSFYEYSVACSENLDRLSLLISAKPEKRENFENLSLLVQKKLETLEAFSNLADRTSVVSELSSISRQLDPSGDTLSSNEKPLDFIRSLFVRDRRSNGRQDSLYHRVLEEVEQVRRKQSQRLVGIDALELEFLTTIGNLSSEIEEEVSVMRLDALNMVQQAALERESSQAKSNRMIRLFSATAVLFLLLGGFAVLSYLRKRKQYELALKQAKQNAEAYSAMQERFVANMSHEVRTPIHAIAGFSEQLAEEEIGQRNANLLHIQSAVGHLKQVVDDILDFSKLRAGKMKLMLEPFSPVREAESVLAIFQSQLKTKKLDLLFDHNLKNGVLLMGDALRFRQVLINLLGNAIKFTNQGFVSLKLMKELNEKGRLMLLAEVTDSGIGISQEQLEKIFLPFEQAEIAERRDYRGTGLGLTITREIIEQQGGEISLESNSGKGTKVVFSVPYLEAEDAAVVEPTQLEPGLFSLKGKKILVADDEEWNRRLIEVMLEKFGAFIFLANDGSEALEKLKQKLFDLVLIDIRMPGLSGLEVAKRMRSGGLNADVPVIALTALVGPEVKNELLQAGVNQVLSKPFSEEELLNVIMQQQLVQPNEKTGSDVPDVSGPYKSAYNPETVKNLGAGNEKFAKEMVLIFIRNTGQAITEIDHAVKAQNREAIAWQTHKMAPPARQIGAARFLKLVKELEESCNAGKNFTVLNKIFKKLEAEGQELFNELKKDFPEE